MSDELLPTHPRTGLTAIGWRRDGAPIWPVMGAAEGDGGDGGAGDDGPGDGGGDTGKPPDSAAEIQKWKAMARKHEAQAKANADAAKRLQDMEMAGKSETEKLQAQVAELRDQSKKDRITALKLQVAADKGLPPSLAKFLPDLTEEVDMIDAAEELLAASGSAAKGDQSKPTRQPKSNLTSPLGDDDPTQTREALISSMLGRAT